MAYRFRIRDDLRCVFSRGSGALTYADLKAHTAGLLADSRFQPDFRQLCDLTPVRSFLLSISEVREYARHQCFEARAMRAIIGGTQLAYGMSRMFASYTAVPDSDAVGVQVFADFASAVTWLDLPQGDATAELAALEAREIADSAA